MFSRDKIFFKANFKGSSVKVMKSFTQKQTFSFFWTWRCFDVHVTSLWRCMPWDPCVGEQIDDYQLRKTTLKMIFTLYRRCYSSLLPYNDSVLNGEIIGWQSKDIPISDLDWITEDLCWWNSIWTWNTSVFTHTCPLGGLFLHIKKKRIKKS